VTGDARTRTQKEMVWLPLMLTGPHNLVAKCGFGDDRELGLLATANLALRHDLPSS
jgi:hypothetical protein